MTGHVIRLIGIDPGLRRAGWGVIESDGVRLSYVASGFVSSTADEALAYRLREIFEGLAGVISSFKPQEAAVEETFVNDNARATLKLGQARGMAMLAPAMRGLVVAEYPPNLIKKSVVGAGHAEKRQVQMMVKMLLPKATFSNADEADALAGRDLPRPSTFQPAGEGGACTAGGDSMIGKLRGKVDAIGESHCIIDVNGVGYEVQASARALRDMTIGAEVSLTIDTHVREDAIRLYGFASEVERNWFRTLQGVQGVGSKVALGVLGILAPQDLANAIAIGDWAAVGQTPGVGKKIAQRIVTELKDKAPALSVAGLNVPVQSGGATGGSATMAASESNSAAEAISALCNLGYQPAQASQAVAIAAKDLGEGAETAQLIRNGLKALAR